MKTRKVNAEEIRAETLCEHVTKLFKNERGDIYGYEQCEHLAKWKIGPAYRCGRHRSKKK